MSRQRILANTAKRLHRKVQPFEREKRSEPFAVAFAAVCKRLEGSFAAFLRLVRDTYRIGQHLPRLIRQIEELLHCPRTVSHFLHKMKGNLTGDLFFLSCAIIARSFRLQYLRESCYNTIIKF